MIDDWDSVLQQNVPIVGVWTSDAHKTDTFGPAQYIYASSLDFDPLMRSYYEGREFMAGNSFPGQAIFNVAAGSLKPYPARYPIFVSSGQTAASVHLKITGGVPSGGRVLWLRNGVTTVADTPGTTSYDRDEVDRAQWLVHLCSRRLPRRPPIGRASGNDRADLLRDGALAAERDELPRRRCADR